MQAQAVDTKLTAMGKDERSAVCVRLRLPRTGEVYGSRFNKVVPYKRRTKNHLMN
jgi:hypothetical protein